MSDLHRINGRWMNSPTENLCVHLVNRAQQCVKCDANELAVGIVDMTARFNGAEARAAALETERDAAVRRAGAFGSDLAGARGRLETMEADLRLVITGNIAPNTRYTGVVGDVQEALAKLALAAAQNHSPGESPADHGADPAKLQKSKSSPSKK